MGQLLRNEQKKYFWYDTICILKFTIQNLDFREQNILSEL